MNMFPVVNDTVMKVLIVEDEALLAMDIESIVVDAGHRVVGEAGSLREVMALPSSLCPDLAFVDMQLDEGSSGIDVSANLRARWPGVAVVFVTANPRKIPEDFAGAHGVISKPFSRNGLLTAMRYLEEGLLRPPPVSPAPDSFKAFPRFQGHRGVC